MRATLRMAAAGDAQAVADIYAPYVRDTYVSFEVEPPAAPEMRERMLKVMRRWPWLVCEAEDAVAGYAYASEHHARAAYQWSVDVAVYVHQRYHRRGIGRALYAALLPLLTVQGFYMACAGVTLPNNASVGLHEAVGFRPVGVYRSIGYKLGAWRDVGWWQRPLRPPSPAPSPPAAVDTLPPDDVRQALADAARQINGR